MQLPHRQFLFLVIGCLPLTCGCAVFMALKGKEDPNLGVFGAGQDRAMAIATLGPPHKTYFADGNRVDVFKLKRGDKPSAGRAIAHGVLDVMTIGVWEVIGTPIEVMQGETFYLTVSYDDQDRVVRTLPGDNELAVATSQEKIRRITANGSETSSQSADSLAK